MNRASVVQHSAERTLGEYRAIQQSPKRYRIIDIATFMVEFDELTKWNKRL